MKVFLKSTFAALMICALASISIAAAAKDKVKTENVTFASDTMVNGTLVKAGDYQMKFNEQTGELSILKDGKVKAKTTAQFQTSLPLFFLRAQYTLILQWHRKHFHQFELFRMGAAR